MGLVYCGYRLPPTLGCIKINDGRGVPDQPSAMDKKMRILSLGAGVQSSTLALMMAKGEIEPVEHAIFADTMSEPAEVYVWLDWLEKEIQKMPHPFPIHRVTAGNLHDAQLKLKTSKKTGNKYVQTFIPAYTGNHEKTGLLGRRCTANFKIAPLLKMQRKLAKVPRNPKDIYCQTVMGISADEAQRMKPSQVVWAENIYPLVDLGITRKGCLAWMEKNGFPRPPRSACTFCPFHSDEEWKRIKTEMPGEFDKVIKFERELQRLGDLQTGTARFRGQIFLHPSGRNIDEVVFKDAAGHQQLDLFGNECEGMCGV